jgi:multidrug resistance efflux pump
MKLAFLRPSSSAGLSLSLMIALLAVSYPATMRAQEADPAGQAEPQQEKTPTETAQDSANAAPKPIKLDGVFQAVNADEIRLDVQEWSSLSVVEAARHGATVQPGDVLLKLETDKLELAIEDAQNEIATDELGLLDSQVKLELARRSQELALKAAAAADRVATEELKDFVTTGRDRRLTSLEKSVVNSRNRLEYQAEELKQLQMMYAADDLTEETEEIILKRTRDAVESAQYSLELVLDSQRRGVEFEVPRSQEQLEEAVAKAALALEEARRTSPQAIKRQELQFAKQQQDLEKKKARLERLRADLKRLVITAPRSGVVYYGALRAGKWPDSSSIEPMLQPGGTPKVRDGLMTVVQLRPMTVRATVPEASVRLTQPDTKATIAPIAFPDIKLKGRVVERSAVPIADGQFIATFALDDTEIPAGLVPGMKAQITIDQTDDAKEGASPSGNQTK